MYWSKPFQEKPLSVQWIILIGRTQSYKNPVSKRLFFIVFIAESSITAAEKTDDSNFRLPSTYYCSTAFIMTVMQIVVSWHPSDEKKLNSLERIFSLASSPWKISPSFAETPKFPGTRRSGAAYQSQAKSSSHSHWVMSQKSLWHSHHHHDPNQPLPMVENPCCVFLLMSNLFDSISLSLQIVGVYFFGLINCLIE